MGGACGLLQSAQKIVGTPTWASTGVSWRAPTPTAYCAACRRPRHSFDIINSLGVMRYLTDTGATEHRGDNHNIPAKTQIALGRCWEGWMAVSVP